LGEEGKRAVADLYSHNKDIESAIESKKILEKEFITISEE